MSHALLRGLPASASQRRQNLPMLLLCGGAAVVHVNPAHEADAGVDVFQGAQDFLVACKFGDLFVEVLVNLQ